jgi:hypothetical protein
MIGAFQAQTLSCEPPHFPVNQRQQVLERSVTTVVPLDQELCDFRAFGGAVAHCRRIISEQSLILKKEFAFSGAAESFPIKMWPNASEGNQTATTLAGLRILSLEPNKLINDETVT